MPKIDFQRIKDEVHITKVAEYLGLPPFTKDQIRVQCPRCESDNPRGLAVTKSVNSYYCHIERRGGDCVGLLAHVQGIGQRDAAEIILRDLMNEGSGTATARPRRDSQYTASRRAPVPPRHAQEEQQETRQPVAEGMEPLDYLDPSHETVAELGFTADDAERLGVGYANRGVLRGLVAIPLRTEDGILCGYAGVAEGRIGKLHFPEKKIVPFKKRA